MVGRPSHAWPPSANGPRPCLAGAGGPLDVSEVAQEQPRGKRANELSRTLEPQTAGAYRLGERHGAGPHARDRPGVGVDDEVGRASCRERV